MDCCTVEIIGCVACWIFLTAALVGSLIFALVPVQRLNQTYGWGTESGDSFGDGLDILTQTKASEGSSWSNQESLSFGGRESDWRANQTAILERGVDLYFSMSSSPRIM
eukprot:760641-Hanusia_phi.AAC.1